MKLIKTAMILNDTGAMNECIHASNLKIFQMSASSLSFLNEEVQVLLANKDFNNPKLRTNLRTAKLSIFSNPAFENESNQYLQEATRFAELNLLFTLASRSSRDYENAINNVKFFYENVLGGGVPAHQGMVTAIHLLFLLSSNRTQEFYSKLEAISAERLRDPLLSYVLLLNDAIEEGNYRKVFSLRLENPLPEYFGPFLDTISETIRTEIARSAEKAYAELSLKEALSIFQFGSAAELKKFAESYQEGQEDRSTSWVFQNDRVIFEKENSKRVNFNSEELIRKVLEYSQELERIA